MLPIDQWMSIDDSPSIFSFSGNSLYINQDLVAFKFKPLLSEKQIIVINKKSEYIPKELYNVDNTRVFSIDNHRDFQTLYSYFYFNNMTYGVHSNGIRENSLEVRSTTDARKQVMESVNLFRKYGIELPDSLNALEKYVDDISADAFFQLCFFSNTIPSKFRYAVVGKQLSVFYPKTSIGSYYLGSGVIFFTDEEDAIMLKMSEQNGVFMIDMHDVANPIGVGQDFGVKADIMSFEDDIPF